MQDSSTIFFIAVYFKEKALEVERRQNITETVEKRVKKKMKFEIKDNFLTLLADFKRTLKGNNKTKQKPTTLFVNDKLHPLYLRTFFFRGYHCICESRLLYPERVLINVFK